MRDISKFSNNNKKNMWHAGDWLRRGDPGGVALILHLGEKLVESLEPALWLVAGKVNKLLLDARELGNWKEFVQWDDLRQTMLSSIDRVTAEIREIFQQMQNLAQKCAFLNPEVILSMNELNLDQAPRDTNKEEFQLERVRLQVFVPATDPGYKKELISSGSLSLLK
ncbi:uncharacterized protein TNCV_450131 [Trichonephila clavipes]|nr:uncharacterized protein TNCV_450131 [Trichonephila clavipes]